MSLGHGAKIVMDGLVFHLDASNPKSYPGSGDIWYDVSGNRYEAVNNGAIHTSEGFEFDGNSYLNVRANIITGYPFTMSCWSRIYDTQNGRQVFMSLHNASNRYFCVGLNSGEWKLTARNTTQMFLRTSQVDTNFHNFVGLFYSSNHRELYIDGELAGTDNSSVGFTQHRDVIIGRQRHSDAGHGVLHQTGITNNIILYDRAISSEEVKQNFEATRSRYGV